MYNLHRIVCSQAIPLRLDWKGNVHTQTFEELVSMNDDMAIGNGTDMARPHELERPARGRVPPLRRATSQGGSMK